MKWIVLLLGIMLLGGCAVQPEVRETIEDCMPEYIETWTEKSYDLIFGVPEEVSVTFSKDDWTCYESTDGSLEIYTVKLLSASLESAVKLLSGIDADEVSIIETSRFSLPEYKFCWCANTDDGARVYYADIVIDDIYTYGLLCSAPEECWKDCDQKAQAVFSSFGLFFDEGV